MRGDTIAIFAVVLMVAAAAVGGGRRAAVSAHGHALLMHTSEAGLVCVVRLPSDWEIAQGVICRVEDRGGVVFETMVGFARPGENLKREIEILEARQGHAVAIWQSVPERKLLAMYDSASGTRWPNGLITKQGQELWREIAGSNGVEGASFRDFSR